MKLGRLGSCALVIASTFAGPAGARVEWLPLSIDQALDEAARTNRMVMVDVWAEHCGQCKQMEIDVWEGDRGTAMCADLIPIQINSVTPDGQAFMRRYPIMGLPVVLFLRPDGTELDRVAGYTSANEFFHDAEPIARGMDMMPILDAQLAAHPDSLPLLLDLLEKHLNHGSDLDAKEMLFRILEKDKTNRTSTPERALLQMAKYESYFRNNQEASLGYWRQLAETFPQNSSIGGAMDGAHKCWVALGREKEWLPWACGLATKYPKLGYLNNSVASLGYRNHLLDPCIARAARAARAAGVGAARLDTIAMEIERQFSGGK